MLLYPTRWIQLSSFLGLYVLLCECTCHTFLGVQVPVDAGIAGIACLQSLHMFPLFAPEPDGLSAAAGCSPRPEKYQNNVRIQV